MKNRPPIVLVAIVSLYLVVEMIYLIMDPEPAKVVRLVLAALIGVFMIRGSYIAIFIWAALCIIAALIGFAAAFKAAQVDPQLAVVPGLFALAALAQGLYLLLAPSITAYVSRTER
ncbi:MAG: hypothetical protein EON58_08675 [Alphaproteobacteria bacterium]|nr:MAG: hypothetical protein EON58_08675 [Alphaproteobacteria bacterium]